MRSSPLLGLRSETARSDVRVEDSGVIWSWAVRSGLSRMYWRLFLTKRRYRQSYDRFNARMVRRRAACLLDQSTYGDSDTGSMTDDPMCLPQGSRECQLITLTAATA